jgi:hypothetical protein
VTTDGEQLRLRPQVQGSAHDGRLLDGKKPQARALDVLLSLLSDASTYDNSSGFEDWASELGMDPDSRSALKTYQQVDKQAAKLRKLLGNDYDTFLVAEQD